MTTILRTFICIVASSGCTKADPSPALVQDDICRGGSGICSLHALQKNVAQRTVSKRIPQRKESLVTPQKCNGSSACAQQSAEKSAPVWNAHEEEGQEEVEDEHEVGTQEEDKEKADSTTEVSPEAAAMSAAVDGEETEAEPAAIQETEALMPETAEVPTTPEIAELPEMPAMQEAAEIPAMPTMQEAAEMPAMPAMREPDEAAEPAESPASELSGMPAMKEEIAESADSAEGEEEEVEEVDEAEETEDEEEYTAKEEDEGPVEFQHGTPEYEALEKFEKFKFEQEKEKCTFRTLTATEMKMPINDLLKDMSAEERACFSSSVLPHNRLCSAVRRLKDFSLYTTSVSMTPSRQKAHHLFVMGPGRPLTVTYEQGEKEIMTFAKADPFQDILCEATNWTARFSYNEVMDFESFEEAEKKECDQLLKSHPAVEKMSVKGFLWETARMKTTGKRSKNQWHTTATELLLSRQAAFRCMLGVGACTMADCSLNFCSLRHPLMGHGDDECRPLS